MGRMDVTTPGIGPFAEFNAQVLATPDIRPLQLAPADGNYNAPYAFPLVGLAPFPIKEDVEASTMSNMEYGIRLGTAMSGWQVFLYYFDGWQDDGALDFSTLFTEGAFTFRHPENKTYGYSFNKFFDTGNFIFRGEGSMTTDKTQTDFSDPKGYTAHDFYQVLFGFDRDFSGRSIGTDSALSTAFQVYYAKIDDWDENALFLRTAPEDFYRFTMLLTTNYYHGTIVPTIFVMYDTEEAWMTNASISWSPDYHWYVSLSQISFYGDTDSQSAFGPLISTSELALKIGWRW